MSFMYLKNEKLLLQVQLYNVQQYYIINIVTILEIIYNALVLNHNVSTLPIYKNKNWIKMFVKIFFEQKY